MKRHCNSVESVGRTGIDESENKNDKYQSDIDKENESQVIPSNIGIGEA